MGPSRVVSMISTNSHRIQLNGKLTVMLKSEQAKIYEKKPCLKTSVTSKHTLLASARIRTLWMLSNRLTNSLIQISHPASVTSMSISTL